MPYNKDYVPSIEAEFDVWLGNLVDYTKQKTEGPQPAWNHIPQEKVNTLANLYGVWHAAYVKTHAPHTPVDTEAKNDARADAKSYARDFVQQYLKFSPVTNEDRTAVGVHNKDTIKTPVKTPESRPVITELRTLGGFQVEIPFSDEHSPHSRARPYGCNGCLLSYTVGPEKENDRKAFTRTVLMTHSPFILKLAPEDEGAFLSGSCRWQAGGELGPWSDIHHCAIA